MLPAKYSVFCFCDRVLAARVYVDCAFYVGYEAWKDRQKEREDKKYHPCCHSDFGLPLYRALCIFLSRWLMSARNICSISIRVNTNILFNNH